MRQPTEEQLTAMREYIGADYLMVIAQDESGILSFGSSEKIIPIEQVLGMVALSIHKRMNDIATKKGPSYGEG